MLPPLSKAELPLKHRCHAVSVDSAADRRYSDRPPPCSHGWRWAFAHRHIRSPDFSLPENSRQDRQRERPFFQRAIVKIL